MQAVRVVCLGVFVCALVLPAVGAAEPSPNPPSPADRLTSALTAMGQAQVGDAVLKAWLAQQGEIPRLSGEQLAGLKGAGLSDDVLLHLVRRSEAPATEEPVLQPTSVAAEGPSAKVRVLVQSVPAVDFCELALDGTVIATLGRLLEGEVPAGSRVPRSKALSLRKPTVLFEGEVAPGRHVLQTGFVASRVREEFGDLRQGRRQRLVAEGVRAVDPGDEVERGTVCSVDPGEVCLVTARFRKVDRGYTVSYDTLVTSEREAEVQAANWAAPDP